MDTRKAFDQGRSPFHNEAMHDSLLVFDCFGVLYDEIAPVILRHYFGPEKGEEIKNAYFPRIDRGELDQSVAFQEWERLYGVPASEFEEAWKRQTHAREDVLNRVKELSKTHDIVLLSNAPKGMVERLFASFLSSGVFQHIYSSSALGLAKPDPKIYQVVQNDFKKTHSHFTMIDDNPANLVIPKKLGWNTVLFRGLKNLEGL